MDDRGCNTMVVSTNHIWSFFKMIRLPNLIMVAATLFLMRYCIIDPMLNINGFELQLSNQGFFLLVLSIVCLTAGGYVINDYFDQKTDMVNHPETVIVGRLINRRWAMVFHIIFSGVAILAGIYLSFIIHVLYLSLLFIAGSGILWFYSTTYKRQLIIGNLVVSVATAMVPIMVLLFELPLLSSNFGGILDAMGLNANHLVGWILGFAMFAFIISLIREIVKDTEDFEGDQAYGMQTLPIVLGIRWTKIILYGLIAFFAFGLYYIYHFHLPYKIVLLYLIPLQLIPLLIVFFLLYKANSKTGYHRISIILKFMMASGILFSFVSRYLILNNYLIY